MKTHIIVSKSAGPEWAGWHEHFQGNVYHSIDWAETRLLVHSDPLYFHWRDDNNTCLGIAVGIERRSPARYLGRFFKRLDFETYPAAQDNNVELIRSMIRQLADFAKEGGYGSLTIASFGSPVMVPDMDRLGFVTTPRREFILDLTIPEGELWRRLSEHHRRKIKKAGKHGLLFGEACTMDAMSQVRKLHENSRERRLKRGEKLGMQADEASFMAMGKNYFNKGLGRIFFMTHENRVVTAAFVSVFAGKAIYVYGGSSQEGFQIDAPALSFWKIFSRCRDLGCKEFNLGGVPASSKNPEDQAHGLYRFKAGFGGREVACLSGEAENLRPLLGTLQNAVKRG